MRLIDADVMKKNLLAGIADENGIYADLARQLLCAFADEQPTIDAVTVVRCKDCMYWDKTWRNEWPPDNHYCPMLDVVCSEDFYCAYAERS